MNFPEIHQWWPRLSIDGKHLLERHGDAPVPDEVVDEIRELTGVAVPSGTRLTTSDRDYIRTQREAVD